MGTTGTYPSEPDIGPFPSGIGLAGNVFRRDGRYWTVVWEGTTARLRDAKGLHYLAALLRQPGTPIRVTELIAAPTGRRMALAGSHTPNDAAPSDETERARKAVTNRIKDRLVEIRAAHPPLWRHFTESVKTGTYCAYTPAQAITWNC